MNRKASFNAIANLITSLSDEQQLALVDFPDRLAEFTADLIREKAMNTYFAPISDKNLPQDLREVAPKWRRLACDLDYYGPVAWRVRAGFTIKEHAAKVGPCLMGFDYLREEVMDNDFPTTDMIVFWVPRVINGSLKKSVQEQKKLMEEVRNSYGLPSGHLTVFGTASLLAGLILAHFLRTGERVPYPNLSPFVRTDTYKGEDGRFYLGGFGEEGLGCWGGSSDHGGGALGVFPLGLEAGR